MITTATPAVCASHTTIFIPSAQTSSGLQAIKNSHAAHPSQYCFADEISARNYERELKSQPYPDGTIPITLVTGRNSNTRTAMIRALIQLRHGCGKPQLLIAHSEDSTRRYLAAAAAESMPYVWFYSEKHHSHALAVFAASQPLTRIYLMSPLPCKPSISASINRMSRIICLSA